MWSRKREYRVITKAQAKELLAKVGVQRALDAHWVTGLTRTMDAGLWDTAPGRTCIALDKQGRPINGQHRLAAYIASKLSEITFEFALDCEPEDFKSFDTDVKTRSTRWVHSGTENATRDMARAVSFDQILSANYSTRNTQAMRERLHHQFRKIMEWAGEVMPRNGHQQRAACVAAFMYVWKADPVFADEKAKAWVNGGQGLSRSLVRLRDSALRGEMKGTYSETIRMTLRLLNALALSHQKKPDDKRMNDSIAGLRYFSEQLDDGTAKRWEKSRFLLAEE